MGLATALKPRFWVKAMVAVLLVALVDQLFYDQAIGWTLGLVGVALIAAVLFAHPACRRDPRAAWALALAAALALAQVENPSFLGWCLFWLALTVGVLLPRAPRGEDAWRWLQRLVFQGTASLIGPLADLFKLKRSRPFRPGRLLHRLPILILPLAGGALFLALFSSANPIISQALSRLHAPEVDGLRLGFWIFVLICTWSLLRPRFLRRTWAIPGARGDARLPGVSTASVGLSLLVFNALSALENGLDIAFLWSGAPLPKGVTLAQYAHQGAYTLILTALLAGLFVLLALRPGSETARTPWVRRLVVLWVGQNLMLVASSVLRTLDYVEAYSLTGFRIAALIWMGLVAVGLVLICWRMLRGKSAAWLLNANVLAAAVVLIACSVVDLSAVAAAWDVRHAKDINGHGAELDLCYLGRLGDSAVVPLSGMMAGPISPQLRERAAWVRHRSMGDLIERQADRRGWTWRGQRRLARSTALLPEAAATFAPGERTCDGRLVSPPSAPAAPTAPPPPLTAAPER